VKEKWERRIVTGKIDAELNKLMNESPDAELEAIVVASGSLDELLNVLPNSVGVRRRFKLISAVEVVAVAADLRELADSPSVKKIEPVRDVGAWQ
jgi:hypothetical protein